MRTSRFCIGDLVLYKGKKWMVAGIYDVHTDWFGVSKEEAIRLREEDDRRLDKFSYVLRVLGGTDTANNVPEQDLSLVPEWDREEV
jgi:hypothetical protein